MGRESDHERWLSLRGPKSWLPVFVVTPLLLMVLMVDGINLSLLFVRDGLPLIWSIAIMAGTAAFMFALPLWVARLAYPFAQINPSTSTIRARRHRAHYSDITSAQLLVSTSKKHRAINLLLRSDTGLRAVVLIRDARRRTLDRELAELVLDVIRQSRIAIPVSVHDPEGRFARYNFPTNVTREDALELIESPPDLEDALPIPHRTGPRPTATG